MNNNSVDLSEISINSEEPSQQRNVHQVKLVVFIENIQNSVGTTTGSQNTPKKRGKKSHHTESLIQSNGKWTEEEHKRFLHALELYGNCWKRVEEYIGTRNCAQIRSHSQKYFRRQRNKTIQELRRSNQLRGKVFVITKEYFNHTACSHSAQEEEVKDQEAQVSLESSSEQNEEEKDSLILNVVKDPDTIDELLEPRYESFSEMHNENELGDGLFNISINLGEDNALSCGKSDIFGDECEDYGLPFYAKTPYEAQASSLSLDINNDKADKFLNQPKLIQCQ